MTMIQEKVFDMIKSMPEDKVYYVLQLLESIDGLMEESVKKEVVDISGNKSSGRRLSPLAGGLVYMADDFDETPDCFKEYM